MGPQEPYEQSSAPLGKDSGLKGPSPNTEAWPRAALAPEPSSGQEPAQHHHPVPELPDGPAPSSPTVLLKPHVPMPPQTTGPALHDPLTRHQAFLGPPERGAWVAKFGLPGGQPTGWGPSSHCILMPLVLMQSGAGPPVSSWKQVQEMQGLCPPDCSARPLPAHSAGPLATLAVFLISPQAPPQR